MADKADRRGEKTSEFKGHTAAMKLTKHMKIHQKQSTNTFIPNKYIFIDFKSERLP